MTTAPAAPSAASARVDADIAGAQRRLVEARAFRSEIDTLRGHARSRGGVVAVSVDATGLVTGLELQDPLPHARDLQRAVLDTVRDAQRDVAAQARAAAEDRFGASSPVVTRLDAELTERFTAREPERAVDEPTGGADLGRGSRWLQ